MNHNLTPKQLDVLRWIVGEIKAGKIGETFHVKKQAQSRGLRFVEDPPTRRPRNSDKKSLIITSDLGKEEAPSFLDLGTVDALVSGGILVFNDRRYTVTQIAYEIEMFDFQNPEPDPFRAFTRKTHRLMLESFNREELSQICFNLDIKTDWVFGDKTDWPFELLLYLYRNNRLIELTPILQKERSNVDWPIYPE